jgi:hypothetical protein
MVSKLFILRKLNFKHGLFCLALIPIPSLDDQISLLQVYITPKVYINKILDINKFEPSM